MNNYIPRQQNIIWLNFESSVGKESLKRRPAVVISIDAYNKRTGLIAVAKDVSK